MATFLNFTSPTAAYPSLLTGGTVSKNGKFFFYCNYPEKVYIENTADTGYRKYLNSANVSGEGHVYAWHQNETRNRAYSALHVTNRGSSTITVQVINYGLTSQRWDDVPAWSNYFSRKYSTTYTLDQGQSVQLFQQSAAQGDVFGYTAHIKITGGSARLQDVVYLNAPNDPINQATTTDPGDSNRYRGVDSGGYVFTLTTPVLSVSNSTISQMIGFGKPSDSSFNSADMASMSSGRLQGCFGQIMNFKMKVKNNTNAGRKIKICIASRGGPSQFLVGLTSDSTFTNPQQHIKTTSNVNAHNFVNIIETDTINAGATQEVNFFTVVPAGSSGPYALSARL